MALWAASVPHCCAGTPGAVAARDVPAKSFYPCRNKGSFCLLPGAQLSHTRDATGHCSPECGPHAFAVTASCPKHPQCLWGHSIQPKTSRGEPGPARTAGGTARCILLFPLAQERDGRAGPLSGGTFPKERSWNRRDCSLKAFLFIQALLKGGVWSRGEFRQI